MPPQCPSCGRFLATDFVRSLADGPAPCPRCGERLTADAFPDSVVPSTPPASETVAESVRPPDLPPETVRERDPLEGWDTARRDADVIDLGAHRRSDVPAGTVIQVSAIVGAGILGGLLGGALSGRRASGVAAGTILAALGAAVGVRQVVEPPR